MLIDTLDWIRYHVNNFCIQGSVGLWGSLSLGNQNTYNWEAVEIINAGSWTTDWTCFKNTKAKQTSVRLQNGMIKAETIAAHLCCIVNQYSPICVETNQHLLNFIVRNLISGNSLHSSSRAVSTSNPNSSHLNCGLTLETQLCDMFSVPLVDCDGMWMKDDPLRLCVFYLKSIFVTFAKSIYYLFMYVYI